MCVYHSGVCVRDEVVQDLQEPSVLDQFWMGTWKQVMDNQTGLTIFRNYSGLKSLKCSALLVWSVQLAHTQLKAVNVPGDMSYSFATHTAAVFLT